MTDVRNHQFWDLLLIEPQDKYIRNRPTFHELLCAKCTKIISRDGQQEEYFIKTYEGLPNSYYISGGIFGGEVYCWGNKWNHIVNAQEVLLSIASGDIFVDFLVGDEENIGCSAYVRINVAEVKIESDTSYQN